MVTFTNLISMSSYKQFDFINIDTEGNVIDILLQIDPTLTQTSLMCVEWNGVNREIYDTYINKYGMKIIYENAENLIFGSLNA